jgi:hypothetical protein
MSAPETNGCLEPCAVVSGAEGLDTEQSPLSWSGRSRRLDARCPVFDVRLTQDACEQAAEPQVARACARCRLERNSDHGRQPVVMGVGGSALSN